MLTRELEYELPADRIATEPAEPRDAARLMVVRRQTQTIEHRIVRDLGDASAGLLRAGDLMVFNQSKVLPAHFEATRVGTGGKVSGLYTRSEPGDERLWETMLESGGKLREGERLSFIEDSQLELITKLDGGLWRARLHGSLSTLDLLHRIGQVPLPPYIVAQRKKQHEAEVRPGDMQRYNTVYARDEGSVAAPTAGLHFTDELLAKLRAMGVSMAFITLHVGLGTFAPIRSERIEDHVMHREWMSVPSETIAALEAARARGGRIVPVGTTSVRAMESLPVMDDEIRRGGYAGETGLLIMPGGTGAPAVRPLNADDAPTRNSEPGTRNPPPYPFRFADALMTNFHLPHSTLLALVAALPGVGIDRLKAWYRAAIDAKYHFYSYGDAMLLI
ncbi:MAG: S-adenosylmethionine:tRNA ribosyltransferase-isomerase [Phycisphaeraceae bacterium]